MKLASTLDQLSMFERIEQMKRDYTDKYVLVDGTRPELARFRDVVGRVKTVNMSGRALVEFDDYHLNVGWYDIDPEFLKVVDKPPPKPAKTEAKKPAPKAAPAPKKPDVASATVSPAAKPGAKPSVAEMLAAARAGGAPKAVAAPTKKPAPAGEPASAGGSSANIPATAKVDRSKMSVADMIAAARSGGAKDAAAPATQAKAAPSAPADEAAQEHDPAPAPAVEAAAAAVTPKSSGERVDKSKMTIDDMVAWCRGHDTK